MQSFTLDDQLAFADLSGDANPIHVDPLAARRLQFGAPVVHGVHIVLRALDSVVARDGAGPRALAALKATFLRPLRLDQDVRIEPRGEKGGLHRLSVCSGREELVRLTWRWAEGGRLPCPVPATAPARPAGAAEPEGYELAGSVPPGVDPARLAAMVPALAAALPHRQLALILATTYLVGMEAPGRHSLFTELDLTFAADAGEGAGDMAWQTRRFDARFALLTLAVDSGDMTGQVKAMVRAAPVAQADFAHVAAKVAPGAFAGQRALVVGASRGLGEIAAKLLAAGGAEMFLTWHAGQADAEVVAGEIAAATGRAVATGRLDAGAAADADLAVLADWAPTHLYFFASPFIQTGQPGYFAQDLLARFCAVYVTGFVNLVAALRPGLTHAFAPSSVYVATPPPTLREYACAKAAAEHAGAQLAGEGFTCTMPRLPALLTDQTAALARGSADETVAVLLEALRGSGS